MPEARHDWRVNACTFRLEAANVIKENSRSQPKPSASNPNHPHYAFSYTCSYQ